MVIKPISVSEHLIMLEPATARMLSESSLDLSNFGLSMIQKVARSVGKKPSLDLITLNAPFEHT